MAITMVLVGILSLVYGLMLPQLNTTLENSTDESILAHGRSNAEDNKAIFLYVSVALISAGFILAAFGFFMPLYQDSSAGRLYLDGDNNDADSTVKTPILVDYELSPFYNKDDESLHQLNSTHNYAFEMSSDWTPSPCESPTDNVSFQTFMVQQQQDGAFVDQYNQWMKSNYISLSYLKYG